MTDHELNTENARWRTSVELRALEVYGGTNQMIQTMEECAELIQALSKLKRYRTPKERDGLIEELADVRIMIEQMEMEFDCTLEVQAKITDKLARLERRLNGDKP